MKRYADVGINLPTIASTYHYTIPGELLGQVQPGILVQVPFGRQVVQGLVFDTLEKPEVPETLAIDELVDEQPVLTPVQLTLAKWLSEATFAPLGACIGLMIPIGLSQHADVLVQLAENKDPDPGSLKKIETQLLNTLKKRGPLRGTQLDYAFRHVDWRASLRSLRRLGLVHTSNFLPSPRISPKSIRTAQLSVSPDRLENIAESLGRDAEVVKRRLAVLQLLASEPLPIDFSWIYAQTGAKYPDLKKLAEEGYIHFNETEVWRDPLEEIVVKPSHPPTLTADQQAVWAELKGMLSAPGSAEPIKPVLIHGITGSGKTELYMRAVAETLERGRQAIVLVPEIALTPQTVRRFLARFPNQVGIYHSKLSEGERYDTWRRARLGDLKVIIGARSALFMPLPGLGLVVLDECDNESYDQTDTLPYYHGVETAEHLARLSNGLLLMGTANPRITQYYKAQQGHWRLLTLPKRILAHRDAIESAHLAAKFTHEPRESLELPLPVVQVVDMREELKAGNRSILSTALVQELGKTLSANQQAILFLNRKGSATYIFCRACGHVLSCPRDDKALTYHSAKEALICHICGYKRKLPAKCPVCGSSQIRQLGAGTEKLQALLMESFPHARLLRWDAETTGTKGAHDLILSHFVAHRADILIGTQMLAKGLDLPLVTLVGVVLAEVGLNLPDYRAAERTFQLLTQVSGRAGRSPLGGKVILQTYQPGHYVIQAAANHDFETFYQQELGYRLALDYPPYKRLVRLEYRHRDPEICEEVAVQMASNLRTWIDQSKLRNTDFIGPVPCFYTRISGLYRWQLILRGPDPSFVLRGKVLRDWRIEVDPPSLL